MLRNYGLGLVALALTLVPGTVRAAGDLDSEREKAIKEAVKVVSPSVVKIETSGGTEVVASTPGRLLRRGTGPTSGLVVSEDGYIVSSSFNFANKPSTIRVELPGQKERRVARVVATDQSRMLTLLKVDLPAGMKLAVPKPVSRKEVEIGFTAIAVGRTLSLEADAPTSVSVGILSAVDRIWGKAFQTDAKVSPTNYGGPLIDLEGRVYGVLVPASPQAEGELAGFEWYDSGIGFAIPLEDLNNVLPRLKKGTEKEPVVLRRGFLGIQMRVEPGKPPDMYSALPVIGTVAPGSAAEKVDLKPGDEIKAINDQAVRNYSQVLHALGTKYEGEEVSVVIVRDKKEIKKEKVVLGGAVSAFGQPFLGILPLRDDPDAGVEVRFVYPKSPADVAGIKAGDRIMKIGPGVKGPMQAITGGRAQLTTILEMARPGADARFEVKRAGGMKTETLALKLGEMQEVVPEKLPLKASAKKALAALKLPAPAAKKPETGLLKKTTPAADHTYWVYIPDNYDANISCAVMVWLHPVGKNKERDFEDFSSTWGAWCDDNNIIMIFPQSDNPRGWTPGELAFVQETVNSVASAYTVDRRRIVAHGMSVGGEMAYYLGFQARNLFRGVAAHAAQMNSNPRERVANQPVSFFLTVGGKDPLAPAVAEARDKLTGHKYSVIFREIAPMGHEYLDGKAGMPTLEMMVRWIDSLDRL